MTTSNQHIKETHMDTRYNWKLINGENDTFVVVVMQRQTPTSSITSAFGGYILSYVLQGKTCWEDPTPSYINFL